MILNLFAQSNKKGSKNIFNEFYFVIVQTNKCCAIISVKTNSYNFFMSFHENP